VVELRKMLLLPLDDLLAVTREFLCKDVSRSGLDRCLHRYGVGNLHALKPATPRRYLFTPPPSAERSTTRPPSGVGVTKVDVFGHEAGRSQLGAPALHRFADEVVGHA